MEVGTFPPSKLRKLHLSSSGLRGDGNLPPGPARCETSSLVPAIGPGTIRAPPPLMRAAVPRRRSCGSAAPRPPRPPTRSYTGGTAAVVTAPFPPADWPRPTAFAKSRRPNCRPTRSSSTRRSPAAFPRPRFARSTSRAPGRRGTTNPSAHPLKLRPSWDDQPPPRARPVPRSLDGNFSSMRHGTAPSRPLLRVGVPRQSSSGSAPPTHPARRPSAPLSPQPPLSPRLSAPQIGSAGSAELLPPSPASRRALGEQLRVRGPPPNRPRTLRSSPSISHRGPRTFPPRRLASQAPPDCYPPALDSAPSPSRPSNLQGRGVRPGACGRNSRPPVLQAAPPSSTPAHPPDVFRLPASVPRRCSSVRKRTRSIVGRALVACRPPPRRLDPR